MLTKTQQIFLVDEKKFFSLSDSIRMFSIVNHLLESRKRYLQLFLVRKIHVKMVQKMKNVKTSKKIFPSIQKMWWHEYVWMKTCPPEVFWTPYHTHKPITRKNPLHFRHLVKKWRFLTHFLPSTKIFACLVNKCWPNFYHEKKALIFFYTTLTLDFSYLS